MIYEVLLLMYLFIAQSQRVQRVHTRLEDNLDIVIILETNLR